MTDGRGRHLYKKREISAVGLAILAVFMLACLMWQAFMIFAKVEKWHAERRIRRNVSGFLSDSSADTSRVYTRSVPEGDTENG